jgi:hypothetical protein
LFRDLAPQIGGAEAVYLGLRLHDLLAFAEQIERQAAGIGTDEEAGVQVVFPSILDPVWGTSAEMLHSKECLP